MCSIHSSSGGSSHDPGSSTALCTLTRAAALHYARHRSCGSAMTFLPLHPRHTQQPTPIPVCSGRPCSASALLPWKGQARGTGGEGRGGKCMTVFRWGGGGEAVHDRVQVGRGGVHDCVQGSGFRVQGMQDSRMTCPTPMAHPTPMTHPTPMAHPSHPRLIPHPWLMPHTHGSSLTPTAHPSPMAHPSHPCHG